MPEPSDASSTQVDETPSNGSDTPAKPATPEEPVMEGPAWRPMQRGLTKLAIGALMVLCVGPLLLIVIMGVWLLAALTSYRIALGPEWLSWFSSSMSRADGVVGVVFVNSLLVIVGNLVIYMMREHWARQEEQPKASFLSQVWVGFFIGWLLVLLVSGLRVLLDAQNLDVLAYPVGLICFHFFFAFFYAMIIVLIGWSVRLWGAVRVNPYFAGIVTALGVISVLTLLLTCVGVLAVAELPLDEKLDSFINEVSADEVLRASGSYGDLEYSHERFESCIKALYQSSEAAPPTPYLSAVRTLRLKGVSSEDSEDVAQVAAIDVCEAYAQSSISDVLPYYMKSVRYGNCDRYRRVSRERDWLGGGDSCDLLVGEPAYCQSSIIDIQQALCQLQEEEREVLSLAGQGYRHAEIAESLGISPTAARQRLSRARKNLRQNMAR